jgi:hypothetical protein
MSLSSSYVIRTDTTIITLAYAPVLLERKAIRIRKDIDQEKASRVVIRFSVDIADKKCVYLIFMLLYAYMSRRWKAILSRALIRPLRMFVYEPIVQLLGLYMAFIYGLLYCM